MESNPAVTISGRIVAEFEDDASQFLSAEPLFVPSTVPSAPPRFVAPTAGHAFLAEESSALAKEDG